MKLYELNYIVAPDLTEKEALSYGEEIKNTITKKKGVLGKEKGPSKITLAYPINYKTEGYLFSVNFNSSEENLKKIKEKIKKEKSILRFLIVKKDERATKEERKSSLRKKSKPEKAKLSDIDKKIDEMI